MARRDLPTTPQAGWSAFGRCGACDKISYPTRKAARHGARKYPGKGVNAYRCPHGLGWHLGHLDRHIIAGQTDRASVYRKDPAQ